MRFNFAALLISTIFVTIHCFSSWVVAMMPSSYSHSHATSRRHRDIFLGGSTNLKAPVEFDSTGCTPISAQIDTEVFQNSPSISSIFWHAQESPQPQPDSARDSETQASNPFKLVVAVTNLPEVTVPELMNVNVASLKFKRNLKQHRAKKNAFLNRIQLQIGGSTVFGSALAHLMFTNQLSVSADDMCLFFNSCLASVISTVLYHP